MRNMPALLLILLITACNSQVKVETSEPVDSRNREIVFQSVNVIPMDQDRVVENQVVVVKDGRISKMGDAESVQFEKNALLIDAKGKYLLPGLAEMHAHVPPIDDLKPMEDVLLLFASQGITTIRGMLGHPKHLELKNMLLQDKIIGPRFYTAGPPLSGQEINSKADAENMVRQEKQAGYDFLKILPGIKRENFDYLAATAKEVNIPFAGHVPFDVGVWHAIEAGYATIDHLDGFVEGLVPGIENMTEQQTGLFGIYISDKADTGKIPLLVNGLKQKHIGVVPTQALAERWFSPWRTAASFRQDEAMKYMPVETLNDWVKAKDDFMHNKAYDSAKADAYIKFRRKLINECNKNGVLLLLGSDAPQIFNVPGFSTHQELQYLVSSGLTPYEALKTGTVNVASFYKAADRGVIKAGAVSDFLLLNGNPLADINNTEKIEGVMLGNKWLSKTWIDSTLNKLAIK